MKRLEETAMILFRQSPCQVDTDDSLDFHKPSLHEELIQTRRALENAYSGFDNVTDPEALQLALF